jgi:AcrR family transcriptional regulator
MLGLLNPPGHLVAQAVLVRVEELTSSPIRIVELSGPAVGQRIADVLDHHVYVTLIDINNTILYCISMESCSSTSNSKKPGRARDPDIDARVLAVANRHLSAGGYEAMSLAAVAQQAGTTRQAVYRRWPNKASLAAAALAAAADAGPEVRSEDPLADLIAELSDFRRGISKPGRLSLVGTMLQDTTAPELLTRYRAHVVAPRRRRISTILQRAHQLGLIDQHADLEVAITLCTGSWYARALAGLPPPRNWPVRTARLVWRAVGGTLPGST